MGDDGVIVGVTSNPVGIVANSVPVYWRDLGAFLSTSAKMNEGDTLRLFDMKEQLDIARAGQLRGKSSNDTFKALVKRENALLGKLDSFDPNPTLAGRDNRPNDLYVKEAKKMIKRGVSIDEIITSVGRQSRAQAEDMIFKRWKTDPGNHSMFCIHSGIFDSFSCCAVIHHAVYNFLTASKPEGAMLTMDTFCTYVQNELSTILMSNKDPYSPTEIFGDKHLMTNFSKDPNERPALVAGRQLITYLQDHDSSFGDQMKIVMYECACYLLRESISDTFGLRPAVVELVYKQLLDTKHSRDAMEQHVKQFKLQKTIKSVVFFEHTGTYEEIGEYDSPSAEHFPCLCVFSDNIAESEDGNKFEKMLSLDRQEKFAFPPNRPKEAFKTPSMQAKHFVLVLNMTTAVYGRNYVVGSKLVPKSVLEFNEKVSLANTYKPLPVHIQLTFSRSPGKKIVTPSDSGDKWLDELTSTYWKDGQIKPTLHSARLFQQYFKAISEIRKRASLSAKGYTQSMYVQGIPGQEFPPIQVESGGGKKQFAAHAEEFHAAGKGKVMYATTEDVEGAWGVKIVGCCLFRNGDKWTYVSPERGVYTVNGGVGKVVLSENENMLYGDQTPAYYVYGNNVKEFIADEGVVWKDFGKQDAPLDEDEYFTSFIEPPTDASHAGLLGIHPLASMPTAEAASLAEQAF